MRISNEDDIREGIEFLKQRDPDLNKIIAVCGPIPLRLSTPGFEGLSSIIISQLLSRASALAIFERFKKIVSPITPETYMKVGVDGWREIGLSRPKQRSFTALCEAITSGKLDLERLGEVPLEIAMKSLTEVKGIGPWTAEIYLMFCVGYKDIFPVGDLALREAIRLAYEMDERPDEKICHALAEKWAPWRSVAARIFWDYYRVKKQDGAPLG